MKKITLSLLAVGVLIALAFAIFPTFAMPNGNNNNTNQYQNSNDKKDDGRGRVTPTSTPTPTPKPKNYTVKVYTLDGSKMVYSQVVPAGQLFARDAWDWYNLFANGDYINVFGLKSYQDAVPYTFLDLNTGKEFDYSKTPITKDMKVTIAVRDVSCKVDVYTLDGQKLVFSQTVLRGQYFDRANWDWYNMFSSGDYVKVFGLAPGDTAVPYTFLDLQTGSEFDYFNTPVTKDMKVTIAVRKASCNVDVYTLDGQTKVFSQTVPCGQYFDRANWDWYNMFTSGDYIKVFGLQSYQDAVPYTFLDLDTGAEFDYFNTPITKDMKVTIAVREVSCKVDVYALDGQKLVFSQTVLRGQYFDRANWDWYNMFSSGDYVNVFGLKPGDAAVPYTFLDLETGSEFDYFNTPVTKDMKVTIAVRTTSYKVEVYTLDGQKLVFSQTVPGGEYFDRANWDWYNMFSSGDYINVFGLQSYQEAVPYTFLDLDTGAEFDYFNTPITKDMRVTIAVKDASCKVDVYALDGNTLVFSQTVLKGEYFDRANWDWYNMFSSGDYKNVFGLQSYQEAVPYTFYDLQTGESFNYAETPITRDMRVTVAIQ